MVVESLEDISCFDENNGSILPDFNGPGPYEYFWTNGQTTGNSIENLEAGSYDLVITDANGCSDSLSFSIVEPTPIIAEFVYCIDFLSGRN